MIVQDNTVYTIHSLIKYPFLYVVRLTYAHNCVFEQLCNGNANIWDFIPGEEEEDGKTLGCESTTRDSTIEEE